jgi:rubredoxin
MHYPQIVGLKCWCCNTTISSITEGRFCSSCFNPIHLTCTRPESIAVPQGRCPSCGADPHSPQALEVRAEIQERIATDIQVICPNCGSTDGFAPFRPDASPNPIVLLFGALPYLIMWLFGAGASLGELQCFKCQYVFRPRSRVREIGCIVVLVLGLAAIMALIVLQS